MDYSHTLIKISYCSNPSGKAYDEVYLFLLTLSILIYLIINFQYIATILEGKTFFEEVVTKSECFFLSKPEQFYARGGSIICQIDKIILLITRRNYTLIKYINLRSSKQSPPSSNTTVFSFLPKIYKQRIA